MNGLEAYRMFLGLKLHFKPGSTYEYNRFGPTKAGLQSFENRKDKIHFLKLTKHKNLQAFLIANLSKNPKAWVGDIAYKPEAENVYLAREKRLASLGYTIIEELNKVDAMCFNLMFTPLDGVHPPILKSYIAGDVSLETLVVLDSLVWFTPLWKKEMGWDPIVQQCIEAMKKMHPFVQYDKAAVCGVLLKKFSFQGG